MGGHHPSLPQRVLVLMLAMSFIHSYGLHRPFKPRLRRNKALLDRAASAIGIRKPWNAPSVAWKFAWKFGDTIMPYLHVLDRCQNTKGHGDG